MIAEEFLTQELKLVDPDGALKVERTEQYRELWMGSEDHSKLFSPAILHLLYRLQSKGFTFEFTSLDTFKVQAPHYREREEPILIL